VLCLPDREAASFIPAFLESIVFVHGPPAILHSDAAPEFLSEAMALMTAAIETDTTTTLGHNACGNSMIEVFWRYWNRCVRIMPDDHYHRWPTFAARITFVCNTTPHESLGGASPYEVHHGVPARNPFTAATSARALDDELPAADLASPADFATAVRTSVTAFTLLARNHTNYVRKTSAARLNSHGHPRTHAIDDRVKIRVPPTHQQMLATGRRSSHLASWRGPCTITARPRLSDTTCSMTEDPTSRNFERAITNILPHRATPARSGPLFDPAHSDPFVLNEIIAVRDEPDSPCYVAVVTAIAADHISAKCCGCTTTDLSRATFRPGWHLPNDNAILLANHAPPNLVACAGTLQFNALRDLLVARNLKFTQSNRLRKKSQRALNDSPAGLFIF
jgi:hypothetical protein